MQREIPKFNDLAAAELINRDPSLEELCQIMLYSTEFFKLALDKFLESKPDQRELLRAMTYVPSLKETMGERLLKLNLSNYIL